MEKHLCLPTAKVNKETQLICGTNGEKMSKSKGNIIDIFLPEKALKKQIMGIQTDSTSIDKPKDYENCNVFKLYSLIADQNSIDSLKENYLVVDLVMAMLKQSFLIIYFQNFLKKEIALITICLTKKNLIKF